MKRSLPIILSVLFFNFISLMGFPNLVLHYPFNGNTNDISASSNHGINNGAVLTNDRFGNANRAYEFNGTNSYVASTNSLSSPFPMSISLWFKTTTTNGGKLFGFGSAQSGGSADYDRHIYMTNYRENNFWNMGWRVSDTCFLALL